MRPSWSSPWLPAALLLGCLVLAYLALRQRTEIVRIDLGLREEDQADKNRLADLRRQLAAAQTAQLQAEKQAAQPVQPPGADGNVRTVHLSDIAKEHPEYAAIQAHQARRNVVRQYSAGLVSLNLTPDQRAKLTDLLVERNLTTTDAQQAATAAGLAQGSAAYWAAVKQATDVVDQEMTSALGTDGGKLYQKLQTASNASNQIMFNYAPVFDDAGASLTPQQTQGLEQAFVATKNFNDIPAANRQDYFKVDPTTGLSPSDNRLIESAAQVLSPAQLQILKDNQILSNKQQAIMQPYFVGVTGGIRIMP